MPEPCPQLISFDEGDDEGKQRAIRVHSRTPGSRAPRAARVCAGCLLQPERFFSKNRDRGRGFVVCQVRRE